MMFSRFFKLYCLMAYIKHMPYAIYNYKNILNFMKRDIFFLKSLEFISFEIKGLTWRWIHLRIDIVNYEQQRYETESYFDTFCLYYIHLKSCQPTQMWFNLWHSFKYYYISMRVELYDINFSLLFFCILFTDILICEHLNFYWPFLSTYLSIQILWKWKIQNRSCYCLLFTFSQRFHSQFTYQMYADLSNWLIINWHPLIFPYNKYTFIVQTVWTSEIFQILLQINWIYWIPFYTPITSIL